MGAAPTIGRKPSVPKTFVNTTTTRTPTSRVRTSRISERAAGRRTESLPGTRCCDAAGKALKGAAARRGGAWKRSACSSRDAGGSKTAQPARGTRGFARGHARGLASRARLIRIHPLLATLDRPERILERHHVDIRRKLGD